MAAPKETERDIKPGERIAKIIARSGLCSRRDAEALIGDRRVSVNGAIIESAALDISPADRVLVDGKPLSLREPPRLWRYYKPKGRVTTHKDPEGRPTVFEALPENLPRLISVGRLDFNTEGLLLLTNDGDLARHLELPSTGWTRRYRVRAFGEVSAPQLQELSGGVTIDKMSYGPIEASLEREQGDNVWISMSIREGKNREVRRIMEHLGLTVNRLIRISFGPFVLGDLEPGQIEEVKTAVLKDQLGPRLSRQLGVRREVFREERRLPPTRSKPTYLRRKPDADARPERGGFEERPLKRRRIFQDDGSEAPKVEFVPVRKPRVDRGQRPNDKAARPNFGGDRPEREARDRPSRDQDRRQSQGSDSRPPRHRTERPGAFEKPPFPPNRQDKRASDSRSGERSRGPWKKREETGARNDREGKPGFQSRDGAFGKGNAAADSRGRFRKVGSEGEKPRPRRFEPGQDRGAESDRRPERQSARGGGEPRPPRQFEASGAGGVRRGKPREERVDGLRRSDIDRRPPGRTGEERRPPRRFEGSGTARGTGKHEERGEGQRRSGEQRGSGDQRSSRDERKPFMGRQSEKSGSVRGGASKFRDKSGPGKTSGRPGGTRKGTRGGPPGKPHRGPRPEPEKETP